jgi:hypothetical protein
MDFPRLTPETIDVCSLVPALKARRLPTDRRTDKGQPFGNTPESAS